MPIVVRLAWHDAGSYSKNDKRGGANAAIRHSPESDYAANKGLHLARDWLEPLKQKVPNMNYADFYQLASIVAIEYSGGPKIPFRTGRKEGTAKDCVVDGRLPDANGRFDSQRKTFHRMGLTDKDIIVLSGAHCLGGAKKERSGFDGKWTKDPLKFDNTFFQEILKEKPEPELLRLISDMCLLDDPEHRKLCETYAKDQDLFFEDYVVSHQKLSELGM